MFSKKLLAYWNSIYHLSITNPGNELLNASVWLAVLAQKENLMNQMRWNKKLTPLISHSSPSAYKPLSIFLMTSYLLCFQVKHLCLCVMRRNLNSIIDVWEVRLGSWSLASQYNLSANKVIRSELFLCLGRYCSLPPLLSSRGTQHIHTPTHPPPRPLAS